MKLEDRFKFEKRDLSYADLHPVVMKNVDKMEPSPSGFHSKQPFAKMATGKEELVKYMSNLPRYLARGEKTQEKALNVGVLDWRRLEKWEYKHKQIPNRNGRCSLSSSNGSSFFSTEASSSHSSRGHSCSPAHPLTQKPTTQCHVHASPYESSSQDVRNYREHFGGLQDLKSTSSNHLKGPQSSQPFSKNPSDSSLEESKIKDLEAQNTPKTKPSQNYRVASSSKGKTKIQDGECRGLDKLTVRNIIDNECLESRETVFLLLPRGGSENRHSVIPHPSDSTVKNGRRPMEIVRRSISEGSIMNEVPDVEFYHDLPRSCPLPSEGDRIIDSHLEPPSSIDVKSNFFSSESYQPSTSSAKITFRPSRGKNMEEKKSIVVPMSSTAMNSADGLDGTMGTATTVRARNLSPTRRFIKGIGMIGKNSSSKDSSATPQVSSKEGDAKFGSRRDDASACLADSSCGRSNTPGRRQSSPLRRLIDPLLKPKAANSHQCAVPSPKDSVPAACKSSDERGKSSTLYSVKQKLDLKSCRTIECDDPHNQKHGSPTVQALLKVAVKNGLPLFTFTVAKNSDILAATMRTLNSSRKDENSWVYTFYTIRETKKTNGSRLNQAGKVTGHGYVPNVVAQMKVSDPPFSNLIRQKHVDQFVVKEFILFAVDPKQTEHQMSNLLLNDELAAIIVKFPRKTRGDLISSGQQGGAFTNHSTSGLNDSFPDVRGYPNSNDENKKRSSVDLEDLFSTTVLLPGGNHGVPSKGEPSPLIERWKSGGLCDCGGWDLGCRIRVLANKSQVSTRSSSMKADLTAERFELFSQKEALDNRPIFSLSPFKDGIFSVELNSSVSLLQAFSICIAVISSRNPSELSELRNLFEEKPSEETSLENQSGVQMEVPAKCASYPPLPPVGRV